MAQAATAKPVPIRLAQRYSNGTMVSYSGRVIARDDVSVCVLIKEEIEAGTRLSITAPFLSGLTSARVFSVSRSTAHPGYYEIFLQIGDGVESSGRLTVSGLRQAFVRGASRAALATNSPSEDECRKEQAPEVPEAVSEAARRLADELEKHPTRKFSRALQEVAAELRPMSLLVGIAASLYLLEARGHIQVRSLIGGVICTIGGSDSAAQQARLAVKQ